jgi:hypothetical protein
VDALMQKRGSFLLSFKSFLYCNGVILDITLTDIVLLESPVLDRPSLAEKTQPDGAHLMDRF